MRVAGFYGVLNYDDDLPELLPAAEALCAALCAGGAQLIQVRGKRLSVARLATLAEAARLWTRRAGVPLVVNDHVDVALAVGADAVHLGQDDLPLAAARAQIRGRLAIGVSTHDPDQARAAAQGGADYLGFGPVFATATKERPDPVQGILGLCLALREVGTTPVVAIGGIGLTSVHAVARAGAAAACVIGAVNRAPVPAAAARRVADAFR